MFQSTRPRGARQQNLRNIKHCNVSFNPRAREGRDNTNVNVYSNGTVSIHAPARGATSSPILICAGLYVSIHAPARGATLNSQPELHSIKVSIHAPARGATLCPYCNFLPVFSFNPRAREGRDYRLRQYPLWLQHVSIHAPARGAT